MDKYVLRLAQEENISVSPAVLKRLIESGSGDAALLYLCILQHRGSADPHVLCTQLGWNTVRLSGAEAALKKVGLLGVCEKETPPPPQEELQTPQYTQADVAQKMEKDGQFAGLLHEVERKLGPLSVPSVQKLLGLYENLGFGADVIFLLVNHCIAQKEAQYGAGRVPTMREIEKEGFVWARRELFSMEAANAFLTREQKKKEEFPAYMAAIGLENRAPIASEARYFSEWMEMGFAPQAIEKAYELTVMKCREFKWAYCNGILKKWHEKGLHTVEEIANEKKPTTGKQPLRKDSREWMKEYILGE